MRFAKEGFRYSSSFLHPRLARHRAKSPGLWRRRQEKERVSQPYPGVSSRRHPCSYSFTFVGDLDAGQGETQEEEEEEILHQVGEKGNKEVISAGRVELWGEEWRKADELEALGAEYLGEDSEMEFAEEDKVDDDSDYLDREDLLAWMCRTSSGRAD